MRLPDGPIRVAGEHQIDLHLHTDVNVPLTVVVEAELTEAPIDLLEDEEAEGTETSDDAPVEEQEEKSEEEKTAE